jgi:hypothetical protein
MFFFFTGHRAPTYFRKVITALSSLNIPKLALLSTSLLLILIISVYDIKHPDTLIYHAQIINWIKNYRLVPGIVHLEYHLGFQSNWFVLCGLFSFGFIGTTALTFINTSVLSWFVIFIIKKVAVQHITSNGRLHYYQFLHLLLLAFCFYGYTAIRLSATSASPDFILGIYILLIGWLFFQESHQPAIKITILFLCCFAFTIKISALPIFAIALFLLFPFQKKILFYSGCFFFLAVIPFIARNVITSGHPFFPLPFAKILMPDWQYPYYLLPDINNYILSYARTQNSESNIGEVISYPANIWIPHWWQTLSISNKILLISLLTSIVLFIKRLITNPYLLKKQIVCIGACIIALAFWGIKAPDPRFCLGFILLFQGVIYSDEKNIPFLKFQWFSGKKISFFSALLAIILLGFSFYRLTYFFEIKNILQPTGITQQQFTTESIDGLKINHPDKQKPCGNIPAPCTYNTNDNYLFRGKTIEEGFKSK